MADKTPSQQRGKEFGELTGPPNQRVTSAGPLGMSHTPAPSATLRTPATGIAGYIQHLGSLMRAPPPESRPIPSLRPFNSPSVSVPPLRRMAPQRGTSSQLARAEPLMSPPPAGVRRSGINGRTFVTQQKDHLWPLYLGRPREVQDRMLEDLRPRPRPRLRDTAFLPPLTRTSSSSSVKSLDESSLSEIEFTEAGEVQSVARNPLHVQNEGRASQGSR